MKYLTFSLFLFYSLIVHSQDFSKLPVYSIEQEPDFSFFKDILHDKKVVLLGEMTHGDGATFKLKTEIVKYLHEELGFNVIALEDGMYSFLKWREKLEKGEAEFEDIFKSMPYQWSNAEEMKDLFSYLEANPDLVFTGFDSYDVFLYPEEFLKEVDSLTLEFDVTSYSGFKDDLNFLYKYRASKAPDTERINAFTKFLSMLSIKMAENCNSSYCSFWVRTLDGLKIQADAWWDLDDDKLKKQWIQNPRDSTMALNVEWLSTTYTEEKIVIWAANYHVAKNLGILPSHKHFQNYRMKTMGDYLHEIIPDKIYCIGTVSYTGSFTMPGEWHEQSFKEKSKNTLEYYLALSTDYAFVDFSKSTEFDSFKMSGVVTYLEQNGNWTNVYDGVLFIKEMTPSTFPNR